jgi:hypothetical protein
LAEGRFTAGLSHSGFGCRNGCLAKGGRFIEKGFFGAGAGPAGLLGGWSTLFVMIVRSKQWWDLSSLLHIGIDDELFKKN